MVTRKNKLRNQKTVVDGITFASKKEAARYSELKLLERAGEITDLQCQPVYRLEVNGQLVCKYIADFKYVQDGEPVVEDVKGMKKGAAWKTFRIKVKLLKALTGIDVVVV